MFCSKCGAEYKEGALFCTKCGNNLQENVNMPIKDMANEAIKQKKGSKKWLIVILVLVLVLGGIGAILWQTGILNSNSGDITRCYNASATVEEIIEQEKKRKDTTLISGYKIEKKWNDAKGIYEYPSVETDNMEEMYRIDYEGGKFLGMKAKTTRFCFHSDERELSHIYYIWEADMDTYLKIKEKVSKKFEDYRIVTEYDEYWSLDDYTVKIEGIDEEHFAVTVKFAR